MEEFGNLKLKDSFSMLMSQASRLMTNTLNLKFVKNGHSITPEQWGVLVQLWDKDQVSQQELAEKGFKNKATMKSLVDHLENHGLIFRIPNPRDKRSKLVCLTDYGRSLQVELAQIALNTTAKSIEGIDSNEIRITRRVLKKLIKNLS